MDDELPSRVRVIGGLDEERRLCYVGFTRARKILRVTWCQKRQDTFSRSSTARFKPSVPSQFLVEAGLMTQEEYRAALEQAGFVPATSKPKARAAISRGSRPVG